jgi:peptidoglycan/xylan/chitin deacetylase (PgdA/CDA1 family)
METVSPSNHIPASARSLRRIFLLRSAALLALVAWHFVVIAPAALAASSFQNAGAAIAEAVGLAESGNDADALAPLRVALSTDGREEPVGWEALGAICLRDGRPALAARAFARAAAFAMPDDPIPTFGTALSAFMNGHADPTAMTAVADSADAANGSPLAGPVRAAAADLALYARLMDGRGVGRVRLDTADITASESDPLLLEIAAFAALRGGDPSRGAALLRALLSRHEMAGFSEDPGGVLTFDPADPIAAADEGILADISVPDPPVGGEILTGRVLLTPPGDLPDGAAYVSYSLDADVFVASTNADPYTVDWNTATIPNGSYRLRTIVFAADRRILSDTTRTVRLANENAPTLSAVLTDDQAAELRTRIWQMLRPHTCRKVAHFALAERAAAIGDSRTALAELESVCAIDPAYRDAYLRLRRFYHEAVGPRTGIWRANTDEKIVALTFDDGPNPLPYRTPALLDALRSVDARATFFVVGRRAEASPDLLHRMHDEGHEIANHSYSHRNLTLLSAVDVEREFCRTSAIVRDTIGVLPRFYRPPGGDVDAEVAETAGALGMAGAYWTVDGFTVEQVPNAIPDDLTKFVLDRVRPGAIILLHNAPRVTVAAVPDIVRGLRERGYTLVTMTELIQRARRNPPLPPPAGVLPADAAAAKLAE